MQHDSDGQSEPCQIAKNQTSPGALAHGIDLLVRSYCTLSDLEPTIFIAPASIATATLTSAMLLLPPLALVQGSSATLNIPVCAILAVIFCGLLLVDGQVIRYFSHQRAS